MGETDISDPWARIPDSDDKRSHKRGRRTLVVSGLALILVMASVVLWRVLHTSSDVCATLPNSAGPQLVVTGRFSGLCWEAQIKQSTPNSAGYAVVVRVDRDSQGGRNTATNSPVALAPSPRPVTSCGMIDAGSADYAVAVFILGPRASDVMIGLPGKTPTAAPKYTYDGRRFAIVVTGLVPLPTLTAVDSSSHTVEALSFDDWYPTDRGNC